MLTFTIPFRNYNTLLHTNEPSSIHCSAASHSIPHVLLRGHTLLLVFVSACLCDWVITCLLAFVCAHVCTFARYVGVASPTHPRRLQAVCRWLPAVSCSLAGWKWLVESPPGAFLMLQAHVSLHLPRISLLTWGLIPASELRSYPLPPSTGGTQPCQNGSKEESVGGQICQCQPKLPMHTTYSNLHKNTSFTLSWMLHSLGQ